MFRRVTRLSCAFDAIYVVNLDSRKDRWDHIQKQLQGVGLTSFERFSAVHGASTALKPLIDANIISSHGLSRLLLPDSDKVWGMDLTYGGLGCALSHILLWSRIAVEGHGRVLVVEDDTEFAPDFLKRYHSLLPHIPYDWELVYLSGLDTSNECSRLMVAPGVSRVHRWYRTTNLYMVNPDGARKLLERCLPLHLQLDTQMNMFVNDAKPVPYMTHPMMYAAVPPMAIQLTSFGTDVQTEMPPSHEEQEVSRRQNAGF